MKINPQIVDNIAASVFWKHAFENGVQETLGSLKDSIPYSIWSLEKAEEELNRYLNSDIDFKTKKALIKICYEEVFDFIIDHVRREKNIIGTVYTEDFKECKEPNFKFSVLLKSLSVDSDENCAYKIDKHGKFEHLGTLLLRTPYPSGVLTKIEISQPLNPFCVLNTKTALGFPKTIVFSPDGLMNLPENPDGYSHFISGVFHIPSPRLDSIWCKLIPNSICVRKSAKFYNSDGTLSWFTLQI